MQKHSGQRVRDAVPSCALTAATSTTNFWPAHVFHVQAAEHRIFRAETSSTIAHPMPQLLFLIFNREEKALHVESNFNELFLASRRKFISHYLKVKRLALGRKNPSGLHGSDRYQPWNCSLRFSSAAARSGLCCLLKLRKSPRWKITLVS